MATTLRARLSLWNATAFALLLGGFAFATYAFVATATTARTDAFLGRTAAELGAALLAAAERGGERGAGAQLDAAALEAVRRGRARDVGIAVFDATPPAPTPRRLAGTGDDTGADAGDGYPFGGPWGEPRTRPLVARAVRAGTALETLGEGPSAERVLTTAFPTAARVLVVGVSQSLGAQHEILLQAREALVAGVVLVFVVVAGGGYLVTWWSLRPIEVISRRAARIEAGTLHERLPVPRRGDELARLAAAFNGLLERVQRTVEQQRQFMADASHELRTPVAIVRGEAEWALAQPTRAEDEYRAAFHTVRAQAETLARLVDDLFLLARANAGEQPLGHSSLYLEEVVAECVRAVRTLAASQGVAVRFVPDAELPVTGDERLLRRMLVNLLDNAIKYTPSGGEVEIAVARVPAATRVDEGAGDEGVAAATVAASTEAGDDDGDGASLLRGILAERWTGEHRAAAPAAPTARAAADVAAASGPAPTPPFARVTVSDTGGGIPAGAQARIFERFYRAHPADTPGGPGDASGAGLGLAIAAWVATAHGGRLALVRSDATGTTFAVELPLG